MSSKKLTTSLLSILAGSIVLGLSLPISNLFIQRTSLAPANDAEFKAVSDLLIKKCADCHTRDLAQDPLYFNLPGANSIIHKNVENGRLAFLLTKSKLTGKEKFSEGDISKLSQAMLKGNMPPLQYRMLHWDSVLNSKEQKLLVTWIQTRQKEYDIRPIPVTNFLHPDLQEAKLGEMLFDDKRLSGNESIACSSCHRLDEGGADHSKVCVGFQGKEHSLNTPTVFNAAYSFAQYWDGRVPDLKTQAEAAVTDPKEMGSSWPQVIEKLQKDTAYRTLFKASYSEGITANSISDAISQYETTLLTPGCRFDKYLDGDPLALSAAERSGFELFIKHDCFSCHGGPALGGRSYEKMGVRKEYLKQDSVQDNGRGNLTRRMDDMHRFKVPTLRNIELTYPYFHDGSAKTLEDAVRIMSEYQIDKPLTDAECKKVVAFLRSLTAPMTTAKSGHNGKR